MLLTISIFLMIHISILKSLGHYLFTKCIIYLSAFIGVAKAASKLRIYIIKTCLKTIKTEQNTSLKQLKAKLKYINKKIMAAIKT